MACIAVYHQDNVAEPAIETIPPVSAQLWQQIMWLIFTWEKGNVIITCSLAFNPHELLIMDWPLSDARHSALYILKVPHTFGF